ncbi:hypothetical protein AGMMS50267_16200 [Spirochaetia bacterium]|nr:hypothetical protein AGMMS50267_16200 [Spirochaetia bacterium]
MEHGIKGALFLAGLLIFPTLCFAEDYYAEYTFDEAREIGEGEIHGGNGWEYSAIMHFTKKDIQDRIDSDKQIKDSVTPSGQLVSFAFRRTASEYMSKMLRASADKRIFIIDTSVGTGPYGWLFIKVNENEYVVFFTGT